MATLLELKTIYDNAHAPTEDGVTPPPEVTLAKELRSKIEAAVWKKAHEFITTAGSADPQEENEAVAWAQQSLASGQNGAIVFRALLAANASATVAAILGASDEAIEGALDAVVRRLARGKHPGR